MKITHSSSRAAATVFLATLAIGLLGPKGLCGSERTLDEFKNYAAEKVPGFTNSQLNALTRGVDKNGDGVISDVEFAGRLEVFEKIAAAGRSTTAATKEAPSRRGGTDVAMDGSEVTPAIFPALTKSDHATVLLITADEIAAAWRPFAVWKTRGGKVTKIITVGQIARDYSAKGIQEQIRLCMHDHIDNHDTRWVVLGGDCLPNGEGLVPGGHLTEHAGERTSIPTDIVYLSPTNWDADNDGIYGEWEDDREAISYPDGTVGLGRVPVRTAADVAAFTDKVIAYESRYPTTDFALQMIYTCTDEPAYPKVRNSWDGYVSKIWDGGRAERFFSQETPWDKAEKPGSHQLNAKNLVSLINSKKIGKLHIHGHGHLPSWALDRSAFTVQHVDQLKNDGAYPLITTVSCNTGEYDSRTDPSIVESMIRQPKGGSVAIVAPIRAGKPHFHNRSDFRLMVTEGKLDGTTLTMTRFWCHGIGSHLTTGEALMKAKSDMASDARKSASFHLCICELNLLGDPTLDLRSNIPRRPTLDVLERTGTGEQSISITTSVPHCTVCIWKGKELYHVLEADESGTARLNVALATTGDIFVTASGPNLNTATATIIVANTK